MCLNLYVLKFFTSYDEVQLPAFDQVVLGPDSSLDSGFGDNRGVEEKEF